MAWTGTYGHSYDQKIKFIYCLMPMSSARPLGHMKVQDWEWGSGSSPKVKVGYCCQKLREDTLGAKQSTGVPYALSQSRCHSKPLAANQLDGDYLILLLLPSFWDELALLSTYVIIVKWLFIVRLWSILLNALLAPMSYSRITRILQDSFKKHF